MLNNNISGSRRPRALVIVVLVDLVLCGHVLGLLSHTVQEVTGLALGLSHDLVDVTLVLVEKRENHPGQQK